MRTIAATTNESPSRRISYPIAEAAFLLGVSRQKA